MPMPIIRENRPQYMAGLKAWLARTESIPLEDMEGFFAARVDGYEAHMQIWRDAYIAF